VIVGCGFWIRFLKMHDELKYPKCGPDLGWSGRVREEDGEKSVEAGGRIVPHSSGFLQHARARQKILKRIWLSIFKRIQIWSYLCNLSLMNEAYTVMLNLSNSTLKCKFRSANRSLNTFTFSV
jgi:hypothetical protein